MNQKESKQKRKAKSERLGWLSIKEQKPRRLSECAGNGIKVERGMFGKPRENNYGYLVP